MDTPKNENEEITEELLNKQAEERSNSNGPDGEDPIDNDLKVPLPAEWEILNVREDIFVKRGMVEDPYQAPFDNCSEAAEWLEDQEAIELLDGEGPQGVGRAQLKEENRIIKYFSQDPVDSPRSKTAFIKDEFVDDVVYRSLKPLAVFSTAASDLYNNLDAGIATASVMVGLVPWIDKYELEVIGDPSDRYKPYKLEGRINVMQNINSQKIGKELYDFLIKERKKQIHWQHPDRANFSTSHIFRLFICALRKNEIFEPKHSDIPWGEIGEEMKKLFELYTENNKEKEKIYDLRKTTAKKDADDWKEYLRDTLFDRLKEAKKDSFIKEFLIETNLISLNLDE